MSENAPRRWWQQHRRRRGEKRGSTSAASCRSGLPSQRVGRSWRRRAGGVRSGKTNAPRPTPHPPPPSPPIPGPHGEYELISSPCIFLVVFTYVSTSYSASKSRPFSYVRTRTTSVVCVLCVCCFFLYQGRFGRAGAQPPKVSGGHADRARGGVCDGEPCKGAHSARVSCNACLGVGGWGGYWALCSPRCVAAVRVILVRRW